MKFKFEISYNHDNRSEYLKQPTKFFGGTEQNGDVFFIIFFYYKNSSNNLTFTIFITYYNIRTCIEITVMWLRKVTCLTSCLPFICNNIQFESETASFRPVLFFQFQ